MSASPGRCRSVRSRSRSWSSSVSIAAVLATPYLIVSHVRGHRAGHAVLRHRLGHALHALLDIAPHRLLAAIRRGHPAR